ncbi:MAG: ABC transporter permease [Planctomycetota bacterium]
MRTIWTLARKDLRLLARDPVNLFFVTGFPLVFAILFGMIYSGGGGGRGEMSVVAVDLDQTAASAALIARLDESDAIGVETIADAEDGQRRVRLGDAVALIVVPAGFEDGIRGVFTGAEVPAITGAIDPSRQAEAGVLEGVATASGFQVLAETLADFEVLDETLARAQADLRASEDLDLVSRGLFSTMLETGRRLAQRGAAAGDGEAGPDSSGSGLADSGDPGGDVGSPLGGFRPTRIELESIAREPGKRPANGFEVTFPQAAAWAILGCVSGFGVSLVRERTSGTLLRLAVAPMPRRAIVGGKAVACFALTVGVLAVLYAAGAAFFGVRVGAWWSISLAVGCSAFAFVGLMMLLASISQTEGGAEGFVRAALLVLALVGGAGIPLFFMPAWMQMASGVSPFRWAIIALEGASFRGYSFAEMVVPCGVLLGIGVVGFGVAGRLFRRWSVG